MRCYVCERKAEREPLAGDYRVVDYLEAERRGD
jgi:hypothetical protein